MGKRFLKVFMIINTLIILNFAKHDTKNKNKKLPGHLKKLGSHQQPMGVTWAGQLSSPYVFFYNFVEPGKPVLMKGVLQQVEHPGLVKWTDEYLSSKFGSEKVKVEESRVENRNLSSSWIPLKDFLQKYQTEDLYMVHSLRNMMKDLALIPKTLHCGGFENVITETVMWMGSHHASSVLHRDPLDNLLCVLSGRKDIVLIDKAYKEDVESDGFDSDGGFSQVDPQRVDFEKFPQLYKVKWHEAQLREGDCLYIPNGWYHHVTSSGFRHVGMNIWFAQLHWFNSQDCDEKVDYKPLEPISKFGFASPNEVYRSSLLSTLKDKGILMGYKIPEFLPHVSEERAHEFFDAINEFQDGAVSWSELYHFDIDTILFKFPDVFELPGKETSHKNNDNNLEKDSAFQNFISDVDNDHESREDVVHEYSDDKLDKDEEIIDDNSREAGLPLPDNMGGNTPTLPDESGDRQVHELPKDATSLKDESKVSPNLESEESGSQGGSENEKSDTLNTFIEYSNNQQDSGKETIRHNNIPEGNDQKHSRDEL